MNRMVVILNLLVSLTYSIAGPIDQEATTSNIEDAVYKIDDQNWKIPDETDILPVVFRKDDIISTSNLNKVYSSLENKFGRTRSLKDETENEGFKKIDVIQESRAAASNPAEKRDEEPKERSGSGTKAGETKIQAVSKKNSKSSEKSRTTAKTESETKTAGQETRSGAAAKEVEESKSAKEKEESEKVERSGSTAKINGESKEAGEEERKTENITEMEKTTTFFRREVNGEDYLENSEHQISDKVAPDKDSQKKEYEMPLNDESNSSWDDLDDLPASRRMISQPGNLNIEVKAVAENENVEPVEKRNSPETKTAPRNLNPQGSPSNQFIPIPQFQSAVSIPHIHTAILPGRRFIVPGFIKVRPPVKVGFRRLQNQEINNVMNQNVQPIDRSDSNNVMNQNHNLFEAERSEISPKSRDSENYNSEHPSNAQARVDLVTPMVTPKTPQTSNVNVFTKLMEASEHPQTLPPNINRDNIQNLPSIPFNNNMRPNKNNNIADNSGNVQNYPNIPYVRPTNYAVLQNYPYVTGFGRLF